MWALQRSRERRSDVMAAKKKTGPAPVAQNSLDPHENSIVEMLTEGRGMRYVALQYKVGLATLFAWMDANPERSTKMQAAMERASVTEDEKALMEIESAQTPFELQKAREIAIHRRWRAKALAPKRYGDKVSTEVSGPNGGPVDMNLKVSFVKP